MSNPWYSKLNPEWVRLSCRPKSSKSARNKDHLRYLQRTKQKTSFAHVNAWYLKLCPHRVRLLYRLESNKYTRNKDSMNKWMNVFVRLNPCNLRFIARRSWPCQGEKSWIWMGSEYTYKNGMKSNTLKIYNSSRRTFTFLWSMTISNSLRKLILLIIFNHPSLLWQGGQLRVSRG